MFASYRLIVGGAINVRREYFGIEGSWGSGLPGSEEVQGAGAGVRAWATD